MSHEILTIKLCELDEQIARLHSRIQLSELSSPGQREEEIDALKKECIQHEVALKTNLQHPKVKVLQKLSMSYGEVEEIIRKTETEMEMTLSEAHHEEMYAEEKLLLAEYELDFAMMAANRALLISLQAIDAQLSQEQKGEKTL